MRSGWPHTQDDHGGLPADQRHVPFGPDISWPTGYSNLEYRDGDYRYPASYTPQPADSHGEHPYAGFSTPGYRDDASGYSRPTPADYGYGDPGYSDLGYDGPASQDAGIAGTRTVRGYVEAGPAQSGYPDYSGYSRPGHALPAPTGQDYGYAAQDYGDSGHIELAYPFASSQAAGEDYRAADTYQQPWDYDRPLRYAGDEPSYPAPDGYGGADAYAEPHGTGSGSYGAQAYDPADYNGSAYSRPGIDGPGYDLSGIIGTGDFETIGYDEPSYDRLAYDDPRYDAPAADAGRRALPSGRSDETRFDLPRYDEARLESLWLGGEDARQDEPVGYGDDGFGTDGPFRSGYPDSGTSGPADFAGGRPGAGISRRGLNETRFDLYGGSPRMDHTNFDIPAYDDTRAENMRALHAGADFRRSATGLLPPPEKQPLNWPDETMIDAMVSDLYLDDEPDLQLPAAYVRTAERRGDTGEDTGARRAGGRRRGRSGDRKQWMALGAIAVVAAGAIGGVLMKYVFSGPHGPSHTVSAPSQAAGYTRSANLEKAMHVDQLRAEVIKTSAGQASNVVSAVYTQGSMAPGGDAQIFMFVGGKLASAAPATSIANFTQQYPGAAVEPAGALGGQEACAQAAVGGEAVAMCVWFDNDSFGELVSPTMTPAKLATTMNAVRPSFEQYAR
jgi:hypothetical protein